MKISLGMKLQPGSWGGGNSFGKALVGYLRQQGCQLYFDLKEPDLDLIILTNPFANSEGSAYTDSSILRYLLTKNRQALVVHRVNECDERKKTAYVNAILIRANACADCTVFVSTWLKNLLSRQGMPARQARVILNGSDTTIFNAAQHLPWDGREPLKLITHHWGGHWMKGFDIYKRLDDMLAEPAYRNRLAFTYIGNLPPGFRFQQANYIPPKSGPALAEIIRQHHVYLTASQNEPGSNHQNEGALCGLPLLYRDSASMPEYCNEFGLIFTPENFEQKLNEMMNTYDHWSARMSQYPHTAEHMCRDYFNMFRELLDSRPSLLQDRVWPRQPITLMRALLPERINALWCRYKRKVGSEGSTVEPS